MTDASVYPIHPFCSINPSFFILHSPTCLMLQYTQFTLSVVLTHHSLFFTHPHVWCFCILNSSSFTPFFSVVRDEFLVCVSFQASSKVLKGKYKSKILFIFQALNTNLFSIWWLFKNLVFYLFRLFSYLNYWNTIIIYRAEFNWGTRLGVWGTQWEFNSLIMVYLPSLVNVIAMMLPITIGYLSSVFAQNLTTEITHIYKYNGIFYFKPKNKDRNVICRNVKTVIF